MSNVEASIICDNVFEYIINELDTFIDDNIFNKISFEELGEVYYNKILDSVEDCNEELLKIVISKIVPEDIKLTCKEDYYKGLCIFLEFKEMPSKMLKNVKEKYNEIFNEKYHLVKAKYNTQVEAIDKELSELESESDKIKSDKKSHSFLRDISNDELRLYELNSKYNKLRTRKDMLNCALTNTENDLKQFYKREETEDVEEAKKLKALKLSKYNSYGVDLEFSYYSTSLNILEDDIERDYALFFKVKIYTILDTANKNYNSSIIRKTNEEAVEEYEQYISKIPKIDDLNNGKRDNPEEYNNMLKELIKNYSVIEDLKGKLESSVCLRNRKNILFKAIELYEKKEFEIFNNILPIQIEGMFADFLMDTTIFSRFENMNIYANAVLKDKIKYLQKVESNIYPEVVEYFMHYFNNIIRNRIAHGRYYGNTEYKQDEIFSRELILDMSLLVHMLSRNSETEKMYRFIEGCHVHYERLAELLHDPSYFSILFSYMIGEALIYDYDMVEKYKPIQVAYWLINPYYEKIYEQVGDKKKLLELREKFLSEDFWNYVLKELNNIITKKSCYENVNIEFKSVVKGLFKCGISDDVKTILKEVYSLLTKILEKQKVPK